MRSKGKQSIEIVAYINFSNPSAKDGRDILDNVLKKLGGNVNFCRKICTPTVPIDNPHFFAAKASLAAEQQGKSTEMYNALFYYEGEFTEPVIFQIAESIDLDVEIFKRDFYSDALLKKMEENQQEADKLGVSVFPSVAINGVVYHGAWDEHALLEAIKHRRGRHIEIMMNGFFKWGASAAFALLLATLVALLYVNLGYHENYEHWRHTPFGFLLNDFTFKLPLEVWISDALMAIFFLLIGLEIKREIIYGELSDAKRAAMPVIAAIGGMVVPALVYIACNVGTSTVHGWGVPMATDIAFTLGLMALLGNRIPLSLKVFVSALAVADDLGAILVIAIFYGHGFHFEAFIVAIFILILMALMNYWRVYSVAPYMVFGVILWFFIFESGLHATLAGVLTAVMIPSRKSANIIGVGTQARVIFEREMEHADQHEAFDGIRHDALHQLQKAIDRLREPAYYLVHALERWVNYSILPLFAFFNTGILVVGTQLNLIEPANLGIILGLCVGKPVGIFGACWLATKMGIAKLSPEISWLQLLGAGFLAGVGFTMSIVVASTAFTEEVLESAKLSILIASTLSAVIGMWILRLAWQSTFAQENVSPIQAQKDRGRMMAYALMTDLEKSRDIY